MTTTTASKLDQLRSMTDVVADTGDIDAIALYKPLDATTNPSLLLKAAQLPRYAHLLTGGAAGVDALAVAIGCEILSIIPGRVSTEVDARLSFDTQRIIDKAQHLMNLYAERGINHKRVLIKIAATWEGIRAAEVLEKRGIHCNLTLLFGFTQAAACADAGVTLISPFVGRILDWHKAHNNGKDYAPHEDPGVVSVTRIYHYYKQHGYNTIVMGASFRNQGEIEALAGCDRLTISPALLQQLADDTGVLERQLSPTQAHPAIAKQLDNEAAFRWSLNEDAMATEKLAEGIRVFTQDQIALEQQLAKLAH